MGAPPSAVGSVLSHGEKRRSTRLVSEQSERHNSQLRLPASGSLSIALTRLLQDSLQSTNFCTLQSGGFYTRTRIMTAPHPRLEKKQRPHMLWVLIAVKSRHYCNRGDDISLQTAKGDNLTRGVPAQLRGVCPRSKVTYRERSVGEHFRTLPPHRSTSTHRTRSGCKARRNIAS